MNLDRKKLKAIKGDASFRFFFRKKNNKKKSIIVYSKKEKRKNLLIYDSINKLLIKNRIKAPKLYNENYNKNYIEIEDLGDKTLYKVLSRKKESKIILFKRVISLLVNIQKIKKKKKLEIFKISFMKYQNIQKKSYLMRQIYFVNGMFQNLQIKI